MSLERVGLGAVVTMDSSQLVASSARARDAMGRFVQGANQAPPAMGRVGRSVSQVSQQMSNAARQIAQGAGQLGQGVRNAAMAMLPLTLGLVGAASQAASFEQQMSAVGAVNQSSAADMLRMSNEAKRMGATTVFTATEAGQAMEFMGRAGANVDQIIGGLAGVMNAAAADGIDLSAATDVIAQTTNIMGREWE